ncbi:hypothetical protein BOO35_10945 [Vibrio navarrensis]|uniref:DUF2860 domain-containing protein n=1 Tax=Vibrio navarrensis TaxID=29495 RepID=UPI001868BFA4|nr:DUF2860 domain-containing protein [Vibrio navarrensis]MBE3665610.1 hypothetical protein [Vibrio navarrensis]MBE4601957.1 hypothetical protein [Vibrio navarrensis]
MRKLILATLIGVATQSAQAGLADSQGYSGELSLITGYSASESNFNTEAEASISDYRAPSSSESQALIGILGNLAYTFGQGLEHQVYLGTTREDVAVGTLALQLGYRHQLPSGIVLDVSLLPTIMSGETWQDPYALNTRRQTTDEDGMAYRFKLENLADGNLSADFAYASKEIEKDSVSDASLRRDSKSYYVKVDYRYMLRPTSFLLPAFTYIQHDADGKAASYDSYAADLSWFNIMDRHRLVLTAGYNLQDYQASSQIFAKTREDQQLSLFLAYEYQNLFMQPQWSFITLAGYNQTSSNIAFYDAQDVLLSVGVNYRF